MTTEIRVLDLSYPAAEDLREDKYHFVVLTSSGTIRRPDTASELAFGILQNAPNTGEGATVRVMGISKVVANDALAIGDHVGPEYVGATDAGKAKDNSNAPAYARAIVVEATLAEDDLAAVLLGPMHAPTAAMGAGDITLASGKIIVGQSGGAGSAVTPAGDVTIGTDGATAIGAGKVTATMLASVNLSAIISYAKSFVTSHVTSNSH